MMYSNEELKEIVLYRFGPGENLAALRWLRFISSHGLRESKHFTEWIFGYLNHEPVEPFLRELSPKEISEHLCNIHFDQSKGFSDWRQRTQEFIEIHLRLEGEKVLKFIFSHLNSKGGFYKEDLKAFCSCDVSGHAKFNSDAEIVCSICDKPNLYGDYSQ